MPRIREISSRFLNGPFASADFVAHGYSEKILRGRRFRRVHEGVWVANQHVMTFADHLRAARLSLPPAARVTGITRIQQLGLHMGPDKPLHFVIDTDLHLSTPGVMLHRTVSMPPADDISVTPAAAFIAYGTQARLIDLVAVGDWLLHRAYMTEEELADLLDEQPWRDGVNEVRKVLHLLRPRSRSVPESKLRMYLEAAGITGLEVNSLVQRPDGGMVEVDLLATTCFMAIEYEGSHHQTQRSQYLTDIDRYAVFRSMHLPYRQVTKELMRQPQEMVTSVYTDLGAAGYQGPPPTFDHAWRALFQTLRRPRRGGTGVTRRTTPSARPHRQPPAPERRSETSGPANRAASGDSASNLRRAQVAQRPPRRVDGR